ncbi:AI-2E family transporter [Candidatus Micrarchaeota archaeon]|nr:AI-2E family transporter [Candidatus Micrarchaeota archaeon]
MNLIHRLQLRDYLFWAVVLGLIALSAFMVLPFVTAIISAYILAYLVRPLFLKLRTRFSTPVSALVCMLIAIVLVMVPIGLISLEIFNQVSDVSKDQGISKIIDAFVAQPFFKSVHVDTAGLKAWITQTVDDLVNSAFQSIPHFALGLIITLNGMFYLLCNWDALVLRLKKYLPFRNNEKIITELGGTADAIIHGHVLISVLEGLIAFIGFSLLGIPGSLIYAVLIFILAFVPSIGPLLVWAPLALYYASIGQISTAVGVFLTGLILMIGIEFIFYTRFVGSRAHIHPFIMLLGVLGGIGVFGIFGFIIGPLLLANSIEIIELAIESHKKN